MTSMNTFSGGSNRAFQLASNSGHVHVNIHSHPEGSPTPQPDIPHQQRWLDRLPNAAQAAFNSSERQHEPLCQYNTRVEVLNEIRAWADVQDERCIYWLNGLAGTGKSTIARTIAREYFDYGRLGASFFFSKSGGDVGNAGKFFTTVALQLAKTSPSLKSYVCGAVAKNSDIETQSLREQWHQLIFQPLSRLDANASRDPAQSSYILVIDALDECEGESDVRAILQLLAEARSLKRVHLRVFLTSRPEIPIRYGFHQISDAGHQEFVLHNISPTIIDHDIRAFLEYNFKIIGQERSLDDSWPGEKIIKCLIQKASGLFIWAATACRFVHDGKRFAAKRLDMILEGDMDATTTPEKHLNEIYVTVLKQSINSNFTDEEREDLYQMLRQTLGSIVVLFSPLSAYSLCKLLHVTKEDINQTLEDLHAILDIPKVQTQPLRLHHPSFRDFLINKERCGDSNFWIEEKQAHQNLANNSIRLMTKSLHGNICDLDTYGAFVTDIDSSRVQQCLPQEVQYACLYWIQHLQMSGGRLYDDDQVHQFLLAHVLHWLEALSWMGKVTEGIQAVTCLESIALSSGCPGLHAFIYDIKRFGLYCRSVIDQYPLQVYCGALVFAPAMSMVRKQFETRMPLWLKRIPNVEKDWNAVLQTLEGHLSYVAAVVFSPDGKVLASGSGDRTVKLWAVNTGAALQTLKGHSEVVNAVAFSPDGKLLASASEDQTVKLWDAGTGAALQTLKGHSRGVSAVDFSPESKLLASASADQTIKLWDASTGAMLQTLKGHSNSVKDVVFMTNGKLLASASGDGTIKLWDTSRGAALQTLDDSSGWIHAVAFMSKRNLLVSASLDPTIKLWDASTGAELQTLKGHSRRVNDVVCMPNGKLLASASADGTIKLWDANTGEVLQTLKDHQRGVNAIAFSPDSQVLASASNDRTVTLWDVCTGAALQTLKDDLREVNAVAFMPERKLLTSASEDQTVKLWDTGMEAALQALEGHSDAVYALAFSPYSKLLASASGDKTIKLWDSSTGILLQTLKGHSKWVNTVTFSQDGRVLASTSGDKTVKLWDATSGPAVHTLKGPSEMLHALAFSPDSQALASASRDMTVKLWDASTGAALQTFKGHSNEVNAVAISPDSLILALASRDLTVKLWDTSTGAALQTLKGHSRRVRAVAFSLEGKLLASASGDRTVKLWNVGTGAALQTLKGHLDVVNTVAFSPEGEFLASASGDRTIKLWDAATGAALQTLKFDAVVQTVSFTNDGALLKTDRGMLHTAYFFPGEFPNRRISTHGIFVEEQWITWGTEKLIWLPPKYRPRCIAVHGNVVALGLESGLLSILEFGNPFD